MVQIIIGSGNSDEVEVDKSELEVNKLSKVEIEMEIDETIIFSIIDLITDLVSKPCTITYNFEAKTLLITCLHFIDD